MAPPRRLRAGDAINMPQGGRRNQRGHKKRKQRVKPKAKAKSDWRGKGRKHARPKEKLGSRKLKAAKPQPKQERTVGVGHS